MVMFVGEVVYWYVCDMVDVFVVIEVLVGVVCSELVGVLCVGILLLLVEMLVVGWLVEFVDVYLKLCIELDLFNMYVDLIE